VRNEIGGAVAHHRSCRPCNVFHAGERQPHPLISFDVVNRAIWNRPSLRLRYPELCVKLARLVVRAWHRRGKARPMTYMSPPSTSRSSCVSKARSIRPAFQPLQGLSTLFGLVEQGRCFICTGRRHVVVSRPAALDDADCPSESQVLDFVQHRRCEKEFPSKLRGGTRRGPVVPWAALSVAEPVAFRIVAIPAEELILTLRRPVTTSVRNQGGSGGEEPCLDSIRCNVLVLGRKASSTIGGCLSADASGSCAARLGARGISSVCLSGRPTASGKLSDAVCNGGQETSRGSICAQAGVRVGHAVRPDRTDLPGFSQGPPQRHFGSAAL